MATETYKRTISGSVGAGMKSLFATGGRRFYTLEHKVSSLYHKAGECQQIIVDQIELGRASTCQVRFDESFTTVSRRHAAIVKDGDNWKLVQLSQTNATYLNGHRVEKEWYLQNGDEIQLSTNGPKLGFIAAQGDKGLVKSIGLTARLNLFSQQALRPYKQALVAMSILFILVVGGLSSWNYILNQDVESANKQLIALIEINNGNQQMIDSLIQELNDNQRKMKGYEESIEILEKQAEQALTAAADARRLADSAMTATPKSEIADGSIKEQCFPYTYFIQVGSELRITKFDGTKRIYKWGGSATGFLLEDGRFITARHVIEPWCYPSFKMVEINQIINTEAKEVEVNFVATSHSGDKIVFTNKQCRMDRSADEIMPLVNEDGFSLVTKWAPSGDGDWAVIQTNKTKGLPFDNELSVNLPITTKLQILGFPHGRGGEDMRAPSPISSHAEVAREGLDVNNTIMTANDNTEPGNSGGPVFVKKDNKYIVVGILSGSTAEKGRVVPIKAAK